MPLRSLLQDLREASEPVLRVRDDWAGPEPSTVALLSGSFDPLTLGHAALAEAALDHADLLLLVYSVRTLPKEGEGPGPLLSERERLAVLEAFRQRRAAIEVALTSHGLLADQVRAAAARFPSSTLALVMGSDKVRQLLDRRWYVERDSELGPLFSRARVLYAVREGDEGMIEALLGRAENAKWRDRFTRLDVSPHVVAVSSRHVRDLIREGRDVSRLVPPEARAVLEGRVRGEGR